MESNSDFRNDGDRIADNSARPGGLEHSGIIMNVIASVFRGHVNASALIRRNCYAAPAEAELLDDGPRI